MKRLGNEVEFEIHPFSPTHEFVLMKAQVKVSVGGICSYNLKRQKSNIYLVGDIEEDIEEVLNHEILHAVLAKRFGAEAMLKLDNVHDWDVDMKHIDFKVKYTCLRK